MRKKILFINVLSLFLLVPASIIWAQTISTQKGLTTAVFNLPQGSIKVYLPENILPGKMISGTVIAKPNGKNEKQLENNKSELSKYSIVFCGENFTVDKLDKAFQLLVPLDRQLTEPLELLHVSGAKPLQLSVQLNPANQKNTSPTQCILPSHALTGSPLRITGPFDGNSSNTTSTLDNKPMKILAESPGQCILSYPENANGIQTLNVQENNQSKCSQQVSGVQLNISAGDLNLRQGQRTYIDVNITGLQNLPDTAILTLINVTTDVVLMMPSNVVAIPLPPDSVVSGTFDRRFNIQSLRSGSFSVNVNLDFKDIMMSPKPDEADPVKDNNLPPEVSGKKNDPPLMEIEEYDPKNPITWDSTPPPGTACLPTLSHKIGAAMEGGLTKSIIGPNNEHKTMQRDDFIVLEAAGVDFDIAEIKCTQVPECPQPGCIKEIPIEGRVRFEWKIGDDPPGKIGTKGSFVQIGSIPDEMITKGEQVIFKPPYVPLAPLNKEDNTILSTVILSVIDAGSPFPDIRINHIITIAITRSKISPDKYTVVITGGKYNPKPSTELKPSATPPGCTCVPFGPNWNPGDDLKTPEIILPAIGDDKDKLVLGQKVLLTTQDQTDMDIATYGCSTTCPTTTIKKSYHDIVRWKWTVEKVKGIDMGKILLSDSSQYIVYEAPYKFPDNTDFLDIKISVIVYNPSGRIDPVKELKATKVFRVYRPGISMGYTPLTWLPEHGNSVKLKSQLVYYSEGKWLPGFSHMSRIQYFELFNISQEKGVCMNYSLPKNNDYCLDLQLRKQSDLEFYDSIVLSANECTLKDQYTKARSEKPVKDFEMTIYSLDYGAYGFFRSFANINKGFIKVDKDKYHDKGRDTDPVYYQSVPWHKTGMLDPLSKGKKTMSVNFENYGDNRVPIPHDLDENQIPDNGWISKTEPHIPNDKMETEVPDPLTNNIDEDNFPEGNKTHGDGLTAYEEYRGFMVLSGKNTLHIRTDYKKKDLFIYNRNGLDISLFRTITSLNVHEINEENMLPDSKNELARVVNFNYKIGSPTHTTNQKALRLVKLKYNSRLLGIACETGICPMPGTSAPPNWIYEIRIFADKIAEVCKLKGIDPKVKLTQVVAHELCHGINICHHGEGNPNIEGDFNKVNGLRSGDVNCVMRYDNSGKSVKETPGIYLCSDPAGTGYNTNSDQPGFGNADARRGNCLKQMQVTGFGTKPTPCLKE